MDGIRTVDIDQRLIPSSVGVGCPQNLVVVFIIVYDQLGRWVQHKK